MTCVQCFKPSKPIYEFLWDNQTSLSALNQISVMTTLNRSKSDTEEQVWNLPLPILPMLQWASKTCYCWWSIHGSSP